MTALSYVQPGLFDGAGAIRSWPWGALEQQSYDLIMIDPPWHFTVYSEEGEVKSPQAHYATMTIEQIAALPVADLARPDCVLWLWATGPMVDQQIEVLRAWRFRFVTSGVWVKTTRHGRIGFGLGYVLRNAHEPFLIGTIGKPATSRSVRSVVMGPLREHSRKPDEAYAAAEKLVLSRKGLPIRRADVFARQTRAGWEGCGDELGKFDEGATT